MCLLHKRHAYTTQGVPYTTAFGRFPENKCPHRHPLHEIHQQSVYTRYAAQPPKSTKPTKHNDNERHAPNQHRPKRRHCCGVYGAIYVLLLQTVGACLSTCLDGSQLRRGPCPSLRKCLVRKVKGNQTREVKDGGTWIPRISYKRPSLLRA